VKIKFLADVNVEKAVVEYLLEKKYDTKWIPEYNCEMLDDELLHWANIENRVIITNDKDFGELIFLQKKISTGIILFRVREQRAENKVNLIKHLLENFSEKILNHFIVITGEKIRIIPLEVAK
jgi:predicted nuclease of predicted toxin-antitoxin system